MITRLLRKGGCELQKLKRERGREATAAYNFKESKVLAQVPKLVKPEAG